MFRCDKCGLCCKALAGNPIYAELDRGDGTCKYLENNLCSIYENRPLLCRVDEAYGILFRHYMTEDEYYENNYKMCNLLKSKQ